VLENETVKDVLGGLVLVGVEASDGLALNAEYGHVVGPALSGLNYEVIDCIPVEQLHRGALPPASPVPFPSVAPLVPLDVRECRAGEDRARADD
jgi:hypothetical protein